MALPRPDRGSRGATRSGSPARVRLATAGRVAHEGSPSHATTRSWNDREAALRRRRFFVLVVLPALLMIGSVYLHTVSSGVQGRVDGLEERLAAAKAEEQELEVRASQLSQPGRVREEARQLGMEDAAGEDIEIYAKDGEDGPDDGGEKEAHAQP